MSASRRQFLKTISASAVATSVSRLTAGEGVNAAPLPALRELANGRLLIGTAVPTHFAKRLHPQELRLLATQFDCVTPENCMKWQIICPDGGDYRFDPVDRVMELASANRQKVVGHTLVFNRDGNFPPGLFRDGEKEADGKLVWKRIEEHVVKLMGRYKGRIDSWDVLNEFVELHDPGYRVTRVTRVLGPGFPERLFKLAAEVDPEAKLTYNDFAVENPDRRKAILAFVRSLLDKGCRVDVVGSQSHLELGDRIGGQISTTIREFAALGVKVALTELDVDVIPRKLYWNPKTRGEAVKQDPYVEGCPAEILEKQAAGYGEVFEAVMDNADHVDRVTFWGINDRNSWLNQWPWKRVNHGLLFDRDANPKPAFHSVAEVLANS